MSTKNENLILLGVIGLGAFWIMSRRPVAANMAGQRPGMSPQTSAASLAAAIAGGIGGLINRGGSGGSGSWTRGSDGWWTSPGGYSTNPSSPTFMGPPTSENMPKPNWGQYAGGGNDGVALNPGNFQDPFDYGQYF